MFLRFITLMVFCGAWATGTPTAWGTNAASELTGSRSESSGQITPDVAFAGAPFMISWTISESGGLFTYNYTITGPNSTNTGLGGMGVSHFALNVGSLCAADVNCITGLTVDGSAQAVPTPQPNTSSSGDTNFPGSFTGVRFAGNGIDLTLTVTFTSDEAPVYGDFYVKLGNGGPTKGDSAWNNGSNGSFNTSSLIGDYVPAPGDPGALDPPTGSNAGVPEPGSVALLGAGLTAMAALRRAQRARI